MAVKRDFEALKRRCEETSAILGEIEEPLLDWAIHKEKLLAPWESLKRKHRELCERLPEQWHEITAAQFAAGRLLGAPEGTRKFLRAVRERLPAEERGLLEHFVRKPWFYCLFRILEHHEGEFFTILDLDTEEERLLRSGAVRSLERAGVQLFLGLLFHDGACLQTYGSMHYYRGFQPYDLHYFARLLDPQRLSSEGLSAVIARSPGSFYLLDAWSEIPAAVHKDQRVELCAAELALPGFDPESYRGRLEIDRVAGLVRCRLEGERTPLRLAAAYYDTSTERLAIQASTPALYSQLRGLLGPQVPLPEQPPWRVTIGMSIAARRILDKQDPASPYIERFEEQEFPETSPEEEKHLEAINALLTRLSDHSNRGTSYSLEALAAEHGVSLETARELEKVVAKQDAAFDLQIEGGLEGYPPPPPAARMRFRLSPWDCGLFAFLDSPRVRRLYAEALPAIRERREASTRISEAVAPPPEELDELPGWLEELHEETQDLQDYTLLNTAFDLLCHRGDRLEPVRDYAVEVLRLFWQVLLPGRETDHIQRFHGRFARFVHDVLYAGGLVDIDPPVNRLEARRAEFALRPSALFRGWVSHREPRGGPRAS